METKPSGGGWEQELLAIVASHRNGLEIALRAQKDSALLLQRVLHAKEDELKQWKKEAEKRIEEVTALRAENEEMREKLNQYKKRYQRASVLAKQIMKIKEAADEEAQNEKADATKPNVNDVPIVITTLDSTHNTTNIENGPLLGVVKRSILERNDSRLFQETREAIKMAMEIQETESKNGNEIKEEEKKRNETEIEKSSSKKEYKNSIEEIDETDGEQEISATKIQRWWRRRANKSLVKQLVQEAGESDQFLEARLRNKIERECVESERSYMGFLQLLYRLFIQPLQRKGEGIPNLSETEMQLLFGNIETIISINTVFLKDIEAQYSHWPDIPFQLGETFINMAPYFKAYCHYVSNYPRSLECISKLTQKNKEFAKWKKQVETDPLLKFNNLESLLIMPIQRIPRYVLLLRELQKHTHEEHRQYQPLKTAFSLLEEVAQYINERKRMSDNMLAVLKVRDRLVGKVPNLVAPHRSLVREDNLFFVNDGKRKLQHVFLFNDLLLWAASKSLHGSRILTERKAKNSLTYKGHFYLKGAQLIVNNSNVSGTSLGTPNRNSVIDGEDPLGFTIALPDGMEWSFSCRTLDQKNTFVGFVSKCISDLLLTRDVEVDLEAEVPTLPSINSLEASSKTFKPPEDRKSHRIVNVDTLTPKKEETPRSHRWSEYRVKPELDNQTGATQQTSVSPNVEVTAEVTGGLGTPTSQRKTVSSAAIPTLASVSSSAPAPGSPSTGSWMRANQKS